MNSEEKGLTGEVMNHALQVAERIVATPLQGSADSFEERLLARALLAVTSEGAGNAEKLLADLQEHIGGVCWGHHDGTCDGWKCIDGIRADLEANET